MSIISKSFSVFMGTMTMIVSLTMQSHGLENGLGRIPPMGWNNFNWFGNSPTATMVTEETDAMVKSGLRDLGYKYVNIDDAWWQATRDASGNLKCVSAFPNGIKTVADYVHGKNMKFGVYLVAGASSWGNGVGTEGHETADANYLAAQGVDFLKYEYMYSGTVHAATATQQTTMTAMSNAIKACGRPIYLSINTAGGANPWDFGPAIVNQWRVCTDVKDQFDGDFSGGYGFNKVAENAVSHWSAAGPGHWNDPDMLIVGLHGRNSWMGPGCTAEEYRSHFNLWCLLAAPLLIGWDPRVIADFKTYSNQYSKPPTTAQFQYDSVTLFNTEMIAVDQDSLGAQGQRVVSGGATGTDIWAKPLKNGSIAVGLYNKSSSSKDITVNWSSLTNLTYFGKNYGITATTARYVRDLWTHKDIGQSTGSYTASAVPSHQMAVVLLSEKAGPITTGAHRENSPKKLSVKRIEIKNGIVSVPPGEGVYCIKASDLQGRQLFEKIVDRNISLYKSLAQGVYVVSVESRSLAYSQRVVLH